MSKTEISNAFWALDALTNVPGSQANWKYDMEDALASITDSYTLDALSRADEHKEAGNDVMAQRWAILALRCWERLELEASI
jgi:hypothetical protein